MLTASVVNDHFSSPCSCLCLNTILCCRRCCSLQAFSGWSHSRTFPDNIMHTRRWNYTEVFCIITARSSSILAVTISHFQSPLIWNSDLAKSSLLPPKHIPYIATWNSYSFIVYDRNSLLVAAHYRWTHNFGTIFATVSIWILKGYKVQTVLKFQKKTTGPTIMQEINL